MASESSMSTLNSVEVAAYFRNLYGFQYTSDENLPMVFPTDSRAERINVVENAVVRLSQQGYNVPAVANELIRRGGVDGRGARVLDMITNSGSWVQEMAATYPTTSFVSLDVKPLIAHEPHPRINFEVYGFYAGIAELDMSFDVVHARQCVMMTKDYNFLLREIQRVLKPGGMLILSEGTAQAYEANDPSVILHTAPRRAAGLRILRRILQSQNIDISAWQDMPTRLDPAHPMWDNKAMADLNPGDDPTTILNGVRGFHSIMHYTHLLPSGPWPIDQDQKIIGALSRLIVVEAYRGMLPHLLMAGMEEAQSQEMIDGIIEELMDSNYKAYVKWEVWCARRI